MIFPQEKPSANYSKNQYTNTVKKTAKFIKNLIKLDKLLDLQTPIFILLVLVLALRIPNLFEPYWYGDEGIYLTLGQSMNKGAKLYTDIIDHKTPLIYYLARVQTQQNFRLLNIGWMLATTTLFYYFTKRLLGSVKHATLAGLIFVLLTTLPWLEGHIPNGELFVLGFILAGYFFISKTPFFTKFLEGKPLTQSSNRLKTNLLPLFAGGIFIGLGILTKVPAVLDMGTIFSVTYFAFLNSFNFSDFKFNVVQLLRHAEQIITIFVGALTPIIFSVVYFVLIGSGKDYLDYGLLYNFRYAGSWNLPFTHPFLIQSFTLPGKALYLIGLVALLSIFKKYLKPAVQFIFLWFGAALFASLLSNRPYPHYFIQLVPPLALVVSIAVESVYKLFRTRTSLDDPASKKTKKSTKKFRKEKLLNNLIPLELSVLVLFVFISVMSLLNFRPYETKKYYVNWFKLVSGQMTKDDYNQSFDSLMRDNYKAAPIISAAGSPDLFIWGTNPMLYALTQTQPTGRFTVSFHIKDFNAYDETVRDVVKKNPPFIVVMNNETHELKELTSYLINNYVRDNSQFDNFVVWKRMNYANNY